jgi:hypothetical protein
VATTFGDPRFENSGFSVPAYFPLPNGDFTLRAYARSSVTGTFDAYGEVDITLYSETLISVDQPVDGASVVVPFNLSGWAVYTPATTGTGIDSIHVYAFPDGGGAPTFLGVATLGLPRSDIADRLGEPRYENSGFQLRVMQALPVGTYTIKSFSRNTVTGLYERTYTAPVTVTIVGSSDPRMEIDTPNDGDTVSSPFTIEGYAVDLAASSGVGVDEVHVWVFPTDGRSPFFAGGAIPSISRPDVEALYGSQFLNSGFEVNVTTPLISGAYEIGIYAHSTVTGTFNNSVRFTVNVP